MLRKLETLTKEYVNNGSVLTGYSSLEDLYKDLDSLSEKDWGSLSETLSAMAPMPYSYKYGPISDQIPAIIKQNIIVGILVSIATYYETQSILRAVAAGTISAALGSSFLIERACKKTADKDALIQQRVDDLLQHDRFFQPPNRVSLNSASLYTDKQLNLSRG